MNREVVNLAIERIALQFIKEMNPKFYDFTVIDPRKLGNNFKNIRRLEKVIFDEEDIKKNVTYHYNESIKVVNECFINYKDIDEYNRSTGENQAIRFLFIADFPFGFRDCFEKLNTLLNTNKEAGIYLFMTYDKAIDVGTYRNKVDEIMSQLTLLREVKIGRGNTYQVVNHVHSDFYNKKFQLRLDDVDTNLDILRDEFSAIIGNSREEISFDITKGIRIPIGKVAGQMHYLTVGHETDNYQGIIGGQPGKGKSVLLNNIVAKGIEGYSSQELNFILVDCAGVGFQEFKNSKHVLNLSSSSNVEECVESVKYIENVLIERENLFKDNQVTELRDYIRKTGKKLPRIMCIIDEFHVLFTGSSRTSSYVETVLVDRVIRIGRKFGIHLIVSTQSLGGGIRRSILDNIPLRIALGMTADQSTIFLGYKNEAAANLERGLAVYNNENGALNANKIVRVNFIQSDEIEKIVNNSLK